MLDARLHLRGLRRLCSYAFVVGNCLFDAVAHACAAMLGRRLNSFTLRYQAVAAFQGAYARYEALAAGLGDVAHDADVIALYDAGAGHALVCAAALEAASNRVSANSRRNAVETYVRRMQSAQPEGDIPRRIPDFRGGGRPCIWLRRVSRNTAKGVWLCSLAAARGGCRRILATVRAGCWRILAPARGGCWRILATGRAAGPCFLATPRAVSLCILAIARGCHR